MLKFIPLDKNAVILKDYFEKSLISFCDISVGVRFMWRREFSVDYAIENEILYLKETTNEYKDCFYFPIPLNGKKESAFSGLKNLEEYCLFNGIPLVFCYIDDKFCRELSNIYKTESSFLREWSDYIYDAQAFKNFTGKKYSGQRNHINKFKKTYIEYSIKHLEKSDLPEIYGFLKGFESENDFSDIIKAEEETKVREISENFEILGQKGIIVKVKDKIVGLSIGEVVGDTLIVHVEKALKEYEGIYPFLANEFAKTYADNSVKFINREEDCGDAGLRTSKLQYHPIEIKNKNFVKCIL